MTTHRTGPPSYQGRPLTHPDEELVDQGLQFDIGTLLSRRRMFGLAGVGALGLTLAACTSTTAASTTATASSSTGLTETKGDDVEGYLRLTRQRHPERSWAIFASCGVSALDSCAGLHSLS